MVASSFLLLAVNSLPSANPNQPPGTSEQGDTEQYLLAVDGGKEDPGRYSRAITSVRTGS